MLSHFSPVGSFATPWIVALQAHLSMRVSRQEYRRGLPSSPPGELPNPGIKPVSLPSPEMQADSLPLAPSGKLMEQPRARYISIMRLLTERCRSTQIWVERHLSVSNLIMEMYLALGCSMSFPDGASGKESACISGDGRDTGLIPGLGSSPGGELGSPLRYSCLETLMDR